VFLSAHHDTIALVVYINTDVSGHSFGFKSSSNALEKYLLHRKIPSKKDSLFHKIMFFFLNIIIYKDVFLFFSFI